MRPIVLIVHDAFPALTGRVSSYISPTPARSLMYGRTAGEGKRNLSCSVQPNSSTIQLCGCWHCYGGDQQSGGERCGLPFQHDLRRWSHGRGEERREGRRASCTRVSKSCDRSPHLGHMKLPSYPNNAPSARNLEERNGEIEKLRQELKATCRVA